MQKRIGVFGPTLSGKTTLAIKISQQYWKQQQIRSIVLDPYSDEWGPQAMVFTNEEKFWDSVWNSTNSLIIVEESSSTIQRDKKLIPVFTKLRHNGHSLMVIGHSGMDLLPVMRQQLSTVYLFRQPEMAAKVWCENFANKDLLQTMELNQYEFIYFECYGAPLKMKLKL
jgi:hypothetical protein